MKKKMYFKDYSGEKTLVIAESSEGDVIAIGEVIDISNEKYVYLRKEDFMKFVRSLSNFNDERAGRA